MPNDLTVRPGQHPYVFVCLNRTELFGRMVEQAVLPWVSLSNLLGSVGSEYDRYRINYTQSSLFVPVVTPLDMDHDTPRDPRFTIPDAPYLLRSILMSFKGQIFSDTTTCSIFYPARYARDQFAVLVGFTLRASKTGAIRLDAGVAQELATNHGAYLDYIHETFPIVRES